MKILLLIGFWGILLLNCIIPTLAQISQIPQIHTNLKNTVNKIAQKNMDSEPNLQAHRIKIVGYGLLERGQFIFSTIKPTELSDNLQKDKDGKEIRRVLFVRNQLISEGDSLVTTPNQANSSLIYLQDIYVNGKKRTDPFGILPDTDITSAYINSYEGLQKIYYENGQLLEISNYKEGLKDGMSVTYFDTGLIAAVEEYKLGLRDGEFFESHPNGQILEHKFYKQDLLTGEFYAYYPNGQILDHRYYIEGLMDGSVLTYFPNGNIETQGQYTLDKKSGEFKRYYINGQLESQAIYVDDILQGAFNRYFPNGKMNEQLHYVDGIQSGEETLFYDSGELARKGTYSKGQKNGEFVFYNTKQEKIAVNSYQNDKLISTKVLKADDFNQVVSDQKPFEN